MKTIFSKKSKPDPELLALKAELQEAQGELSLAYRRFDQALDPELVESCVYQISAVKARCNYLIRVFRTPLRLALKLLCNTLLGFLALWVVSLTSGFTGIALGLNLWNALVIGVLGLPGFVLLLLVQWVL